MREHLAPPLQPSGSTPMLLGLRSKEQNLIHFIPLVCLLLTVVTRSADSQPLESTQKSEKVSVQKFSANIKLGEASSRTLASIEPAPTTLAIEPKKDVSLDKANTLPCQMHARKFVWRPNLSAMLETEDFSSSDFDVKEEVLNEPLDHKKETAEQRAARLQQEKNKKEEVIRALREFENLFQDLYGSNIERLDDEQFLAKEIKRAEYWISKTFTTFNKKQKGVLLYALKKWMRHYFKGAMRSTPATIKRILVRRIDTLEVVFNEHDNRFRRIFCFDPTKNLQASSK